MATKNVCNCPQPPGGSVSCEPDQLAICRVINGVPETECIDPPPGIDNLSDLDPVNIRRYYNWALQHITGQWRPQGDAISPRDEAILRRGVYRNVTTGEDVWFRLPDELNLTSPSSVGGSRSGSGGGASGSAMPSDASGGATSTA